MTATSPNPAPQPILVWDLPTRAFHWLLVLAFAGAYVTGDSKPWLVVHSIAGYTVLGLVAFRLLWGAAGTRYARFASFACGPHEVAAYLASLLGPNPRHFVGHNPAGAWAIFALLALAALAGATGWLTLFRYGGKALEKLHEGAAQVMLAVVAVHVAGVLVSSFLHRENLVRAMLDGYKSGAPGEGLRGSVWIVGVALIAAVAAFWVAALRGNLPSVTQPALERQQQQRQRHRGEFLSPPATAAPAAQSAGPRSPPAPR